MSDKSSTATSGADKRSAATSGADKSSGKRSAVKHVHVTHNITYEIIIGGFVVGTLAFIVAHAWSELVDLIVKNQIKDANRKALLRRNPDEPIDHQFEKENEDRDLLIVGISTLVVTVTAIVIVYLLIKSGLVRQKPRI